MTVVAPAVTAAAPTAAELAEVRDRLAELAPEHDRTGEFPWRGIDVVHRAGLLRLGIGPRDGGTGLGALDGVRVFRALGAGDPAVALIASQAVLVHESQARAPWWPEELYREVVAASAERPVLLNAIRAEPEWGAPARGGLPATRVRRTADGWVLTGRKGYATGVEGLAYHLVWAATEGDDPLVAHAIVPADSPGIEIVRTWDHLGQRATGTHDVIYHDVGIPTENFVGARPADSAKDGAAFALAALVVPAIYAGVADAAAAAFARFAHDRVPTSLGRPIATAPHIQQAAGEVAAHLATIDAVLDTAARAVEEGAEDAVAALAPVKLLVTRSAIAAVERIVAVLGNNALTRSLPFERHLRDVLAARVHPPQEDAALGGLGRALLARAGDLGD